MDFSIFKNQKIVTYLSYLKKDRPRKISFAGLTIGATIIFLLFAINPTISTIAGLRKQLQDEQTIDQALQTKISNMNSLQTRYEAIQPDLDFVTNAIPQEPDSVNLTAIIQQAASASNSPLQDVSIENVDLLQDINAFPKSFSFSATVGGSYSSISAFIDKLFNMQRVLIFDSISIDKNQQTGQLTATVKGNAYFSK